MDKGYFFWVYGSPDGVSIYEMFGRVGGTWYTTANNNTGEFKSLWHELTRRGSPYKVKKVLL